jgi:tetratricopeptide (TPR) repeat protein
MSTPISRSIAPEDIRIVQQWIDQNCVDSVGSNSCEEDEPTLRSDTDRCLQRLLDRSQGACSPLAERLGQVARVGHGNYGLVFRAFDRLLHRPVAVKVLRPSARLVESVIQRFELEGRSLAKCNFDGVVSVFEVGQYEDLHYIVMAYAGGPNLAQLIHQRETGYSPHEAIAILEQIAAAVEQAHQQGILHRDLKPSNILTSGMVTIGKFPVPKTLVTDFGLAKDLSQPDSSLSTSTTSPIIGTVRYMPPEQAQSRTKEVSTSSDIFSLGVILYELLSLQTPFPGETQFEILNRLVNEAPASLKSKCPHVPSDILAIVSKCLEKNPADRYQTVSHLRDDLRAWQNGRPVMASKSRWLHRVRLWTGRNPWLAAASCVAMISILGGTATVAFFYHRNVQLLSEARAEAKRADQNIDVVLKSVHHLYQFVAEKTLLDVPQSNQKKLELHRKALQTLEEVARQSEYDERSRYQLSIGHNYVANAAQKCLDLDLEWKHRRIQYEMLQRLVAEHPDNADYHFDLFFNRQAASTPPLPETRIDHLREAMEHLQRAMKLRPDRIEYLNALSHLHYLIADHWVANRENSGIDVHEAAKHASQAIEIARDLVKRFPDRLFYRPLVAAYTALANIEVASENYPAALKAAQEGRQVLEEHGVKDPDPQTAAEHKYRVLGVNLTSLWATDPIAAMNAIDEYVSVADWLSEQDTKFVTCRADGAYQLAKKAEKHREMGERELARQAIGEALRRIEKLELATPEFEKSERARYIRSIAEQNK